MTLVEVAWERALGPPTASERIGDRHLRALLRGHGYLMNGGFEHLCLEDEAVSAFETAIAFFELDQLGQWLDAARERLDTGRPVGHWNRLYWSFGDQGLRAETERVVAERRRMFAP
ncbi:MAG: hypothetical protein JJ863_10260 [Deltaproteobacteria bacterium]|nr:hypothetical protein [Deltaproteobacteria bacterium]